MKLSHCQLDLEYKLASFLILYSPVTVFKPAGTASGTINETCSKLTIVRSPTATGLGMPQLALIGLHCPSMDNNTGRSKPTGPGMSVLTLTSPKLPAQMVQKC